MMAEGIWILEHCASERFPYRLQIQRKGKPWLILRTQDRWPAAGKNIFCLREEEPPKPGEVVEEMERVPIVTFHERGSRISVILDRKRYKRCDFLFLSRQYKHNPTESYEQIFWLTQRSIEQHRPAAKLVRYTTPHGISIRIASDEHYPWRFSGADTKRGPLPVGDYALTDGDTIIALVERKTFENILGDFGTMPVLHQHLAELVAYDHHALVIEALYADFLSPKKVHHYTTGFCAKAIGELYALHPNLNIVFCANRKIANEWTRHYFSAIWNEREASRETKLAQP
ncbi:MAG: hypothetical protein U9Q17_04065 [Chloroflexota bacterium]|nr:hypothetical protein [Chloroflexota bacterium]